MGHFWIRTFYGRRVRSLDNISFIDKLSLEFDGFTLMLSLFN